MGNHHRTGNSNVAFEIDPDAANGRHRVPSAGPGAGVKAGVVAAATGALLVGAGQMGAGTAAAAPATQNIAGFEIPQGLLPVGLEVPAGLSGTQLPALSSIELPPLPDVLAQVNEQVEQFTSSISSGSVNPLSSNSNTVQPVSGTLTSDFGSRWGAHHGGLDIAAPIGTPVRAAASGKVIDAGPASGFGLWVRVQHDDGAVTTYGHVNDYQVNVGERVNAGQQIATVGNRGQSTGPHLHFEVAENGAKVDPAAWLRARGVSPTWA
ncbi:M23 family metallopeptidase [Rhodococcus sp. ARC_M6]|uniref:M23 family metallopeptidase n=1 Tax=Rhodococcus sp. ARC_M6 TaxID=2928852 RepID=UPI001FB2F428|nr:M23 family metallopeptidase [Rhodococcus sp. ARC_M6]MCJ0905292.1 M23 family metallopeptidase [Rhodococcus sp. ARC_M6]